MFSDYRPAERAARYVTQDGRIATRMLRDNPPFAALEELGTYFTPSEPNKIMDSPCEKASIWERFDIRLEMFGNHDNTSVPWYNILESEKNTNIHITDAYTHLDSVVVLNSTFNRAMCKSDL